MRRLFVPFVILPLLLLSGCREAQISSYRVAKEQPEPLPPVLTGDAPATPHPAPSAPTPGVDPAMANTAVPTASGNDLSWTAPAHWKTKPPSAMRKGSYAIVGPDGAEADLSITAFPGDVGGDLANINRWRGQISLPPISAADLATQTEHIDANGLHITFVDFANTANPPLRITGAIVPLGNATWFVKAMGPDSVVAPERETIRAFIQTLQPPANVTQ